MKCRIMLFLLAVTIATGADEKSITKYPEHGKVTGKRTELHDWGIFTSVETDVYVLTTESKEYAISGRPALAVGLEVSFRQKKSYLYIQDGRKERKYWIYTERLIR